MQIESSYCKYVSAYYDARRARKLFSIFEEFKSALLLIFN